MLVSLGVMMVLPQARGGVEGGAGDGASPSALFEDVRIPAEYVPVSLGRAIGSVAGSTFDAQVITPPSGFRGWRGRAGQ